MKRLVKQTSVVLFIMSFSFPLNTLNVRERRDEGGGGGCGGGV